MNSKFFSIFTFCIVFSSILVAQNSVQKLDGPEIQFDHTKHNFGKILESVHYATHRFPFTNIGIKPLFIQQVHTSCGCTTPDWTRDTIYPNKSGFIEARFETNNRIGDFKKTITVYSNAIEAPLVHIDIEGEVLKDPVNPNAAPIPSLGQLNFSMPSFTFNPLYDNQVDSQTLRITNQTPYTANFNPIDASMIPSYIKILKYPSTLEPNESSVFSVLIDSKKIGHYGFEAIELPVTTDNPGGLYTPVYVNFTRKQFFSKMSAKQLAKQPKLKIDKVELNYGKRVAGDILSSILTLTNTGKSELIIHEIASDCGCITLKVPEKKLEAGQSMQVNVFFDTVLKKGNANYTIWVVCNDPTNPEQAIPIKAIFDAKVIECLTCPK